MNGLFLPNLPFVRSTIIPTNGSVTPSQILMIVENEDANIVSEVFKGKTLFSDSPSCGFSENVALIIDGNTYCIACDTCGKIYSVKDDKYFNLDDSENETIRNLLCEYGFKFPCL